MDAQLHDPDLGPRGSGVPATFDDGNATVGQLLRVAREQRGLTLQAIAASTNIPLKHLKALERDDLAAVPRGIYQRAEVRTFAHMVGLDPRIALAALERAESAASAPVAAAPASGTVAAPVLKSVTTSEPDGDASAVAVHGNAVGVRAQSATRLLTAAIATLAIVIAGGLGLRSLWPATPASSPATPAERADAAQPAVTPRGSISTSRVPTTETPASATQLAVPAPVAEADAPLRFPDLQIVSEPSGARVTVDGIGWGETPLTVRYLPPGSKRIRVTMDGYLAQEQLVQLSPDVPTTTVRIPLRRRP
jgi:hypothetical protein